jgi:DNA-binding GntR family transcriptional regulator
MSKSDEVPDKGSNADEAYEAIVRRLRSGQIGPGDRIVDTAIAAEFNMSRMPAREALLRLVNEGYLVGSTRGFRLPELTQADVLEIFEIRKILEPRAAALAAVALVPEQIEQLESAFSEARAGLQAGNAKMLFDANVRFRDVWLDAVPNRRLVAMIERFFDQVNAVRIATLHDAEARQLSVAIGETLLTGFRRGDSLYVFEQMYSFVEAARVKFVALNPFEAAGKASAVK